MQFAFSYWDKSYAETLRNAADELEINGRCDLSITMEKPRDIAFLEGGWKAQAEFDAALVANTLYERALQMIGAEWGFTREQAIEFLADPDKWDGNEPRTI